MPIFYSEDIAKAFEMKICGRINSKVESDREEKDIFRQSD